MKKVLNQEPNSDEGKKLLAKCITKMLGMEGDDWFCLRLNVNVGDDDFVKSVFVGTGWQTPMWAETSDHGPSFAEKQQFHEFFQHIFKDLEISPNPTTPEAVAEFFRYFLFAYPELKRYYLILRRSK